MFQLNLPITALIALNLTLAIALLYFVFRAKGGAPQRQDGAGTPPREEPKKPVFIKCHVQTFEYADGITITQHSNCSEGRHGLYTDRDAQKLHLKARLVHVRNQQHPVRVK